MKSVVFVLTTIITPLKKYSSQLRRRLKSTQMPLKSLIEMNTPSLNGSIIIQGMIEASTRGMHFP